MGIIYTILAMVPTVFMRIIAKAVSEKLIEILLKRFISWGLIELAHLTSTNIDDIIATEIVNAVNDKTPQTKPVITKKPAWWGKPKNG